MQMRAAGHVGIGRIWEEKTNGGPSEVSHSHMTE